MVWKIFIKLLLIVVLAGLIFWPKELGYSPAPALVLPLTTDQFELVEIARDSYVPWSLVFTSDSRMLVSERR